MQAAVCACTGIKVLGVQSCKRKRDACQTNSAGRGKTLVPKR